MMATFVVHFSLGEKITLTAKTPKAARDEAAAISKVRGLGFVKKVKVQKGGRDDD